MTKGAHVLVVNAGSSTLKLRLLDDADDVVARRDLAAVDRLGPGELQAALDELVAGRDVVGIGHRVVHGGTRYVDPVVVDEQVRADLEALVDLAPLHQPKSLRALDAVTELVPHTASVACFDTAFHATLPPEASTYAVPAEWRGRLGVRKYGFHGLSHAYCSARAAGLLGSEATGLRMVTAHLGAGASLTAVVGGRSVDTTMGFTPLDGVVMATRSGAVDPGLVLWLEEHERLTPRAVAEALEHRGGLLALAGTADMREVERRRAAGDPDAVLAFDVYLHRLAGAVGAMIAAAGGDHGIDALVVTGGVGENSATVRAALGERLACFGVAVDPQRNAAGPTDREISAAGSTVRMLVIETREDVEIARGVRAVLSDQRRRDSARISAP